MQTTLVDIEDTDEKVIQKYEIDKYHKRGTKVFNDAVEHYKYVEEHNKRIAEARRSDEEDRDGNSREIMFPCSVARSMPVGDERNAHIKECADCRELIKRLDEIAYG